LQLLTSGAGREPGRAAGSKMRAAFFHDNRFGRDASGAYYTCGALGYGVLARYLEHFDELTVVGRVQEANELMRTVVNGPGIKMACTEQLSPLELMFGSAIPRHVRAVMAQVDCAIARLPSAIGEVACREAIRTGKPWMVELVGCSWDALWGHGSIAGKVLAGYGFFRTRRCVNRAPFALYVSQQFLQSRYPCSGTSLACSDVNIDEVAQDVLERRLRRIGEGFGRRSVVIGLVGSLNVAYKGHETALQAVHRVARAVPTVKLRFLGEGDPSPWRRRAAALGIEGKVEFCGSLPEGRPVLQWMDELDLFIIPSHTEGLPRALVEAMSRALPAIGSNVGGIPELIDGAWTHRPRDHQRLAQLIRALVESPERLEELARRNWSRARNYEVKVLRERRDRFFRAFKAYASAGEARERAIASH
jgi:glycosyltransferase involved in cell wall biosynthesis